MKCYLCPATNILEEHHLIPQARGGAKDSPTIYLCGTCHKKAHLLARSNKPLKVIKDRKLRKIVQILRLSEKLRDHADYYNVQIPLPEQLYKLIKMEVKKTDPNKSSIKKVIINIIAKHFVQKM